MPQGPGYFEMAGKGQRYSDGKGGIFHNHLGPALNQLGTLDPRKAINSYVKNNPLETDVSGKSKVGSGPQKIPSMMTPGVTYGDPTPTIQPGGRPRGAMFMDPVGPARLMPGASSFMDPVAPKDADVTQLVNTPGRQILPAEETREVPGSGGIVQTGKNLGGGAADFAMSGGVSAAFVPEYANSSFNDLLAAQGNQRYTGFNSSQLPETQGNPFSATAPKTQSFNAQAPGVTGNSIADFGGDESAAFASSRETTANDTFNPNAARIEGGSSRKPGGSLDEALADTAGINSYMSKFSSGDQERAANRAFLDTEDSMLALRAKEAVNGVVYAGGQHYISGTSGDDKAIGIDRSQARDISNGNSSAQSLLAAHINKNKNVSEDTPASFQNPLSVAGSAVKSAFAGGAQTDFALNNNQGAPQIGVGPVVKPSIIENYDFTKPGAEEDYFKKLNSGAFFK